MVLLATALSLTGADHSTVATQRRLDRLVDRCAASRVISLTAASATEVVMLPLISDRAPTASESDRFDFVLRGIQSMPDLQLGFQGNATVDR